MVTTTRIIRGGNQVEIKKPQVVQNYNKFLGEVDQMGITYFIKKVNKMQEEGFVWEIISRIKSFVKITIINYCGIKIYSKKIYVTSW